MPERTTVDKTMGLIEVESFGTVSMQDWEKTVAEILKINEDQGLDKVLVDTTKQDSIPDTFRIFEFGQALSRESRFIKYAILIGKKTTAGQKFLETVTLNRGSNYSVFTDKESAMEWLFSKKDKNAY